MRNARRTGTVHAFDDAAGHGEVVDDEGSRLFFHCTAIADGSRTIAVGAEVEWGTAPGHHGRTEAVDVRQIGRTDQFPCPVCAATLSGEARTYEICDRCGWEDDPAQFDDPAYAGGANDTSLNDARTDWVARSRR